MFFSSCEAVLKKKKILLDLLIITIISSQLIKIQVYHTFGGIILSHENCTLGGNMSFKAKNGAFLWEWLRDLGRTAGPIETRLVSGEISAGPVRVSSMAALTPHGLHAEVGH